MISTILSFALMLGVAACLGSASVYGQVVTQPPPTGYVYESVDNGFKVKFPGKPKVDVTNRDSSFGKTPMTSITFSNLMGDYAITIIDFPTVMDDKADLDSRFDLMRDANGKKPGYNVTKDTQLNYGSHYGRDNVFESSSLTLSSRVVMVGPRMFYLIIGTKGRLSTQSERLRAANQRLVDNFFNSFEITKVANAANETVELPADFGISVSGQFFTSAFFGVSLNAPATWVALSDEQVEMLMAIGKEEVGRDQPKVADRLNERNTRALAIFANSSIEKSTPTAMMFIFAERAPYPNFVPLSVARTYQMLYLDKTEKVTINPSTAKIGGHDFGWLETIDTETKLSNRIYFANIKGIVFEILMSYSNEEELKRMMASLAGVSFKATLTSK